jgi:hypothetical protein
MYAPPPPSPRTRSATHGHTRAPFFGAAGDDAGVASAASTAPTSLETTADGTLRALGWLGMLG